MLRSYGWEAAGTTAIATAGFALAQMPQHAWTGLAVTGMCLIAWNTVARAVQRRTAKTRGAERVTVWLRSETIETLRRHDEQLEEKFSDVYDARLKHDRQLREELSESNDALSTNDRQETDRQKRAQDAASVVFRGLEMAAHRAIEHQRARAKASRDPNEPERRNAATAPGAQKAPPREP